MITQQEVKELLHYNPDTGVFNWIKRNGNIAGKLDSRRRSKSGECKKYWAITIKGKHHMAHRLAWLYIYGSLPNDQIDHIDGDGLNNKLSNLRSVTLQENLMNKRKYENNKSGITGVCWDKAHKKWEVQISINAKNKRLGRFDSLFDAACVRKSADIRYGYHANHGTDRPL